jgi:hypothetical protein
MKQKPPRFVSGTIQLTKDLLASGTLSPEECADAEQFLAEIAERTAEEIAEYVFFFEHMPDEAAGTTLVVLKAHLLIEMKAREFVRERLLAPGAIDQARLSSHQLFCLAESFCLPNLEPQWLWSTVRKLNKIRNRLAHNLQPKEVQREIEMFIALFADRNP